MPLKRIRFKGTEFLLVQKCPKLCRMFGEPPYGPKEGAIATPEQFDEFDTSFAHSFSDGTVRRFAQVIGTHDDIEIIDNDEEPT